MFHPSFLKPRYGEGCFSDIPPAIFHSLTAQGDEKAAVTLSPLFNKTYRRVVCFFIDALGWRFLAPRIDEYAFLREIRDHGEIHKLTSQFPSTTAAHMTTFHTGLPPSQSGIFEWQYYEPALDALICPLIFTRAGTQRKETLSKEKVKADIVYPDHSFFMTLQPYGVASHAYIPYTYVNSTFSSRMTRGASRFPIRTLAEGLTNLRLDLDQIATSAYLTFYHADIDSICHQYGPESPQVEAEIDAVLTQIERLFFHPCRKQPHDTLFLLTADHGQTAISPQTTVYLNQHPVFEKLRPLMRTDAKGQLLAPAGSARDFFLYINPPHLEEALALLKEHLSEIAAIVPTSQLLEEGYFGPPPFSPEIRGRIGDIALLPFLKESIWWYEEGRFQQNFYGHHGGLTADEMEIPLLLYPFS